MSAELIALARSAEAVAGPEPLPARIRDKIGMAAARSIADGTRAAYQVDLADFEQWCKHYGLSPLPAAPATVAGYFVEMAWPDDDRRLLSLSTIKRRRAAIGKNHTLIGLANPCLDPSVKTVMQGITRTIGRAPTGQKKGISTADVKAALGQLGDRPIDQRDRLIMLLGFAGALRRSELVAIDAPDIEERPDGLLLHLRRSKRDQEGKGARIEIVYGDHADTCPVRAWRAWCDTSGVSDVAVPEPDHQGVNGALVDRYPLLRRVNRHGTILPARLSAQGVAIVVKRHMSNIGRGHTDFAGHSLRRGHATEASRNNASDRTIMVTTRHRSSAALDPYIEESKLFTDPSSGYLNL